MARKDKKLLTPKQELFLSLYTDPKSKTFSNSFNSAIEAGYTRTYADNIKSNMPDWLCDYVGDARLLNKAVKHLDQSFDIEVVDSEGRVNAGVLGIQSNNARFVASTVGKKRFSTRSNLLDDEGKIIPIPIYAGLAAKTIEVPADNGDGQDIQAEKED